jgi:hypothetical protein
MPLMPTHRGVGGMPPSAYNNLNAMKMGYMPQMHMLNPAHASDMRNNFMSSFGPRARAAGFGTPLQAMNNKAPVTPFQGGSQTPRDYLIQKMLSRIKRFGGVYY